MMWSSTYCFEVTVNQILAELCPFENFCKLFDKRMLFQGYSTQILTELCPIENIADFWFQTNSTCSFYLEHLIIQESVYVLHLITCYEHMLPLIAELLIVS